MTSKITNKNMWGIWFEVVVLSMRAHTHTNVPGSKNKYRIIRTKPFWRVGRDLEACRYR
jgi:hypothetical protein